jgi:stage II sporulation protein D
VKRRTFLFAAALSPRLLLTQQATMARPGLVRVRLFSVSQPPAIRISAAGGASSDVRWDGQRLTVNGKAAALPFRLREPATVSAAGEEPVGVDHELEISARNGKLFVVASFDFEPYVAAVVAGEASVFRSNEALKAMAVAARTYAAHFIGRHKEEGFDFCDSTHCQNFSSGPATERIRRAVEGTAGELIRYDGAAIPAYYHRDCGGVTEGKAPFLPQLQDSFCVSASAHRWTTELSRAEIQSVLQLPGVESFTVAERSSSGRAVRVHVEGPRPATFEAEAFRLAVGRALGWNRVRSDLYDVRRSGDRFVFEGRGAGHGIGLCQDGAAAMGEMGRSYREILAFYYPTTTISGGAGAPQQALNWTKLTSERAELETTRTSQDQPILTTVERLMGVIENATGFRFAIRPLIRVYPSVAAFRDNVGEPGWVAASTRGRVIRLQPVETLRDRGVLESTLRHELTHTLIDSRAEAARAVLPTWFREGIVLWLTEPRAEPSALTISRDALSRSLERPSSEAELRRSYEAARGEVENLVRARGKETVVAWVEKGLPRDLK